MTHKTESETQIKKWKILFMAAEILGSAAGVDLTGGGGGCESRMRGPYISDFRIRQRPLDIEKRPRKGLH